MIRNLKVLGLALLAVFAMSALVASAASAAEQGKFTAETSATGDGTDIVGAANFFEVFGQKVECPESKYDVEKVGGGLVPSGATEVTVTPEFNNLKCNSSGLKMTITMNGCDYVFTIGNTTPAGNINGTYGVTTDIVCPTGAVIDYEIFTSATNENTTACTLTFPAQNGVTGFHLTDNGSHVDFTGEARNVHAVEDKSLLCSAKETNEARYTFNVTITGTNAAHESIPISISD